MKEFFRVSDGPALKVRDLKFRYPGGAEAAEGNGSWMIDLASLDIARGEQVLLGGGSGRGKSTLLYLIAGLNEPTSGSIEVAGKSIGAMHGAARDLYRGRTIGMIFQTFNLLVGFSALENVMMGMMFTPIPPGEHRSRAEAILKRLGIARTHAAPEQLSVGQQQRVAVARAMACQPVLVLADEPTASLDPENGEAAMDLIQEVCRENGAALLCTSHDPAMKARFGRQISLDAAVSGGVGASGGAGAWR